MSVAHPKQNPKSFFKEHKLDSIATVVAFISLIILFADHFQYKDKTPPPAMITARNISFYVFAGVMFYVVFKIGLYMWKHNKTPKEIILGVIVASVIFLLCGIYMFVYNYNTDQEKITIPDKILYWTCLVYVFIYIAVISVLSKFKL